MKKQEAPDPFLAGNHVLVHLDPVGDVWLVSDESAADALSGEGLPVLFERDIRYILEAEGHEARLDRLRACFAKRHPLTLTTLETFQGAKVAAVRPGGAA